MLGASKQDIIAAGFRAIAATRADRWLAPAARGLGLILTFHHVRPERAGEFWPNALLEITPDYLDAVLDTVIGRGFDIVPLDDVPGRLRSPGPRPFVALTFDDGYRDNRDHAWPVLKRHGVPWTMFVATDYASGRGRLWWTELEEVVRRSDRLVLGEGASARTVPLRDAAEKRAGFAAVYADLRAGPEPRLRDIIGRWCEEVGLDPAALVRSLCLGWDELADLAAADPLLTIGAHTLSHPMLAKHPAADAEREIRDSKAVIERRLGRDVAHFAYPVGDPTSAGPREFAAARDAGFRTAVTTRPGHLFAGHLDHLTALPRVSVNGLHQSREALRALLSGVPFLLWNRGRRLRVD